MKFNIIILYFQIIKTILNNSYNINIKSAIIKETAENEIISLTNSKIEIEKEMLKIIPIKNKLKKEKILYEKMQIIDNELILTFEK